jgi:putative hydrolase of the HAD superfamily
VDKQIIIFDLDDTLYLERNFALSGYQAVGQWALETHGVEDFAERCARLFDAGAYNRIFNNVLQDLNLPDTMQTITLLIDLYRNHMPNISLEPDAERFFSAGSNQMRLGMITDGPERMQANKIEALKIEHLFDHIVRTDEWGVDFSKPHPRSFEHMEKAFNAKPEQMIYVADNAKKDFVTPNKRGWKSIQICRPRGVHKTPPADRMHAPMMMIRSFDELTACLSKSFART